MNRRTGMDIVTHSPDDTHRLGSLFGAHLSRGIILGLIGELGSGKTVFIQGLAEGLGVPRDYYITSPTFTLINEYPGRHRLYHVDLYRLEDPDAIEDIGLYDLLRGDGVVAIEWADRLPGAYLDEHVRIQAEIVAEDSRRYGLSAYGRNASDVLEGLRERMNGVWK